MRWMLAVVALLQTALLPPAYPRPGTTKLFENDRVLVWNITWLKQQYPLHKHPYALVGVYYTNGDRIIVSPEGARRPVGTKAWDIASQAAGVTHIEEGASDVPLRAVFVEMKEAGARGDSETPVPQALGQREGTPLVDNDRTVAWGFGPAPATLSSPHHHLRDAVVVSFDVDKPTVTFVTRGTTHSSEGSSRGDRVYVFELK